MQPIVDAALAVAVAGKVIGDAEAHLPKRPLCSDTQWRVGRLGIAGLKKLPQPPLYSADVGFARVGDSS